MERFNYPNIAAVLNEDSELVQLLEYEHWGRGMDEEEAQTEREIEMQRQQSQSRR